MQQITTKPQQLKTGPVQVNSQYGLFIQAGDCLTLKRILEEVYQYQLTQARSAFVFELLQAIGEIFGKSKVELDENQTKNP